MVCGITTVVFGIGSGRPGEQKALLSQNLQSKKLKTNKNQAQKNKHYNEVFYDSVLDFLSVSSAHLVEYKHGSVELLEVSPQHVFELFITPSHK
jgi:hypothetical protein